MVRSNRIKIGGAAVLLVAAVAAYLYARGTADLAVVRKINGIVPVIPVFGGRKCGPSFLSGHLVDFLWFNSFALASSVFMKRGYAYALLVSCLLEFLQQAFPVTGTFDWADIIIYMASATVFLAADAIIRIVRRKKEA